MDELLKYLAASGDIATLAVVFYLWRLDRRVVRVETHVFGADGVRE